MGLVYRIGIFMAELVDDSLYLVMFIFGDGFANNLFKSGSMSVSLQKMRDEGLRSL